MSEGSEKSSKFMNWFWDLASDDDNKRSIPATMILKYVAETQKRVDTPNTMSVDFEYTLKRLIRGLSSSRDSARQGFSACLCQFLKVFRFVELTQVMEILDDTTKVNLKEYDVYNCNLVTFVFRILELCEGLKREMSCLGDSSVT